MPDIHITIRNRVAHADYTKYICDNNGYTLVFDFDDEWNTQVIKTARIVHNDECTDVAFTGSSCELPIIQNTRLIRIGVYAGNLQTTTPAVIHCLPSILAWDGLPADPPDDVYTQIMDKINEVVTYAGKDFAILGYYSTASELLTAVKSPKPGDAYGIGTSAPYSIYIWDAVHETWVNNGAIQGAKGDKGDKGDTGAAGRDGRDGRDAAANLLDNSDFTNPVNQRGQTTYSTLGYTFDRWMLSAPAGGTVSVGSGYVAMYTEGDYVDIQQILERASLMTGKAYTFAVMVNGASAPCLLNFTFGTAASASFLDGQVALIHYNSDRVIIRVTAQQSWIGFAWAAVYEGTYTADTLPNYAPKGYAAELAECRRYFETVTGGMFTAESNQSTLTCVRGYSPKRVTPTLNFGVGSSLVMNCPGVGMATVTVSSLQASAEYFDHISVNESLTAGNVYVYNYTASADL